MALFFFDVAEDGEAYPDRQGLAFGERAEAQAHAIEIAMAFLRQTKLRDADFQCSVTLRDESKDALYEIIIGGETRKLANM